MMNTHTEWLLLSGLFQGRSTVLAGYRRTMDDPADIIRAVETGKSPSSPILKKLELLRRTNWTQSMFEQAHEKKVRIITPADSDWPPMFSGMPDPPAALFVDGKLPGLPRLAIVGARKASPAAQMVARDLAADMARAGWCIVSGGARGVDAQAHEGAMETLGGTIAVMGTGLDVVYPPEHVELFQKIRAHGALVSEFPFGTRPSARNFPQRNRIIAALASGTCVVEAGLRSGSLITARMAIEQGRDVFAVPGAVRPLRSPGTNALIRDGARLVETAEDILEEYPHIKRRSVDIPVDNVQRLDKQCLGVYKALRDEPEPLDMVIQRSGIPAGVVNAQLLHMELSGLVRRFPGKLYARRSNGSD